MAVGKDKTRKMTTIPKTLEKLIAREAKENSISVSEQIAKVLELHYQHLTAKSHVSSETAN